MTISSTNRKAGPYIGNGTASVFPFYFKVFVNTDMEVIRLNLTTNTETTLALTTDYTVTLNADQNATPGGTITLVSGVLPTNFNLVITSAIPNLQLTDLTNQGGFYPDVINDALDKVTIQVQQLNLTAQAALYFPISDPDNIKGELPSQIQRANKVLTFDNDGQPNASIAAVDVSTTAANITSIVTVSDNIADVITVADNIADVIVANDNIVAIIAAPASATAAAASASASAASATSSQNSATAAALALASANLPPSLVGHPNEFLRVKADQTGYEFVTSVAALAFYGFSLDFTKTVLTLTYGRDDYDVANFLTWTASENITFQVSNNQLKQVFL
jgi:hypothetical protein